MLLVLCADAAPTTGSVCHLWHQNCSSTSPLALLVQLLPLTVFYPAVRMAFFFIFVKARPHHHHMHSALAAVTIITCTRIIQRLSRSLPPSWWCRA